MVAYRRRAPIPVRTLMYGQDAEFVIVVSGVAMVLIVGVTLYEAVYTMSAKWRSARRKNRR